MKLGLSNLKNNLLTSSILEGAQWLFSKITFLKKNPWAEVAKVKQLQNQKWQKL